MAGILGIGDDGRHVTPLRFLARHALRTLHRRDAAAGGRGDHPQDGRPAELQSRPEDPLVEARAAREIFERIAAFVQPGGYAAMRLCGMDASEAFIDKTYLHFSGFADNPGRGGTRLCRSVRRADGQAAADRRPAQPWSARWRPAWRAAVD